MGLPWNAMGAPWAPHRHPYALNRLLSDPSFWKCMFCVHGTTTSAERICNCTFCMHETLTFVENKRFVYTKPLLFRVFKMHGVHKGFEG